MGNISYRFLKVIVPFLRQIMIYLNYFMEILISILIRRFAKNSESKMIDRTVHICILNYKSWYGKVYSHGFEDKVKVGLFEDLELDFSEF